MLKRDSIHSFLPPPPSACPDNACPGGTFAISTVLSRLRREARRGEARRGGLGEACAVVVARKVPTQRYAATRRDARRAAGPASCPPMGLTVVDGSVDNYSTFVRCRRMQLLYILNAAAVTAVPGRPIRYKSASAHTHTHKKCASASNVIKLYFREECLRGGCTH